MRKLKNNFYVYVREGTTPSVSPEKTIKRLKKKRTAKITTWSIVGVIICVAIFNLVIMPLTCSVARVDTVESYSGDNQYIAFDKTPMVSAHRAGAELEPEETMKAFKLCMGSPKYDVDILEFDLHITKDARLVLLHDDTLDRTSNSRELFGKKNVKVIDKTYEELRCLNMGENFKTLDGEYPYRGLRGNDIPDDIKILAFDDLIPYLKSVRGDNLHYIIEIKDGGKAGENAMDILYTYLKKFDIMDNAVIGSFEGNVINYIDEKYPEVVRSSGICDVMDFYASFLYNVDLSKKDLGYDVMEIPYDQFVYNFGTKAVIDYAHHYGIAVQFWTINDEKRMRELIENGADAIITDNPELAYKVIHGKSKDEK